MLAIDCIDTTAPNGTLVPVARLFATDLDDGQIYRTTDDVNFNLVFDTGNGNQAYGYWMRTNSLNGYVYASFVGGEHPTSWVAGIWVSTDNGQTWNLLQSFPIHTAYYGSTAASNFYQGTMYFDLELDSGWQNGTEIYPSFEASSSQIESKAINLLSATNCNASSTSVADDLAKSCFSLIRWVPLISGFSAIPVFSLQNESFNWRLMGVFSRRFQVSDNLNELLKGGEKN